MTLLLGCFIIAWVVIVGSVWSSELIFGWKVRHQLLLTLVVAVVAGSALWGLAAYALNIQPKAPQVPNTSDNGRAKSADEGHRQAENVGSGVAVPVPTPALPREAARPESPSWARRAPTPVAHLKRLITYDLPNPIANNGLESKTELLKGIELIITNASDETITVMVDFDQLDVDGAIVLSPYKTQVATIIQQGKVLGFRISRPNEPFVVDASMSAIHAGFTIKYDTIPPTGERTSSRSLEFPISWNEQGHLIAPPTIVKQGER